MFFPSLVGSGLNASQALSWVRLHVGGYREGLFRADFSFFTGRASFSQEMTARDITNVIPLDMYREELYKPDKNFMYQVELSGISSRTGKREKQYVTLVSDYEKNLDSLYEEALNVYYANADKRYEEKIDVDRYKLIDAYKKKFR
jgi:thymidylate kinase